MKTKFSTEFLDAVTKKGVFDTKASQELFVLWCQANDSITPRFLPRHEWKKIISAHPEKLLCASGDDTFELLLPFRLYPRELQSIIEAIDALDPNQKHPKVLSHLGEKLMNASQYLKNHHHLLEGNARELSEKMVSVWHTYANHLGAKELPSLLQDDESTEKWLLGEKAYFKRLTRQSLMNPEDRKKIKERTFQHFFQALSKTGSLKEGLVKNGVGPIAHLQDQVTNSIKKTLETPRRELLGTLFRRGVMLLTTQIAPTDEIKNFFQREIISPLQHIEIDSTLSELINIRALKQELTHLREQASPEIIGKRELEIAKCIQSLVSKYPYISDNLGEGSPEAPAIILKKRFLNCVGASVLGGGLLDHLGIKYLHVDLPAHSATLLLTTDKKAYWQDFTPMDDGCNEVDDEMNYMEITPDILTEHCDFWNIPESGMRMRFRTPNQEGASVILFPPHVGFQCHILNNLSIYLEESKEHKKALEACDWTISYGLDFASPHNTRGNILDLLDRKDDAIEAYKKAIELEPSFVEAYLGLGNLYLDRGALQIAKRIFNTALIYHPEEPLVYNSLGDVYLNEGKYKKALQIYHKGLIIDESSQACIFGIGQTHFLLKDWENCQEYLTRFLKRSDESDVWTQKAQKMMEKAKIMIFFEGRKKNPSQEVKMK